MGKKERQKRIREILREQDIETQEELTRILRGEGFDVTQATVSRDIRELKLTKRRMADGTLRYAAPEDPADANVSRRGRVMKESIVSIDHAQNILVIRTEAGMAMSVATALDAMHYREIVGCIAGDDTIMAAVRTSEEALALKDKLQEIIA